MGDDDQQTNYRLPKTIELHGFKEIFVRSRALTFQKNCFISFKKSPLKVMKNVFYFILKYFFFLRYLNLNFCLEFLVL